MDLAEQSLENMIQTNIKLKVRFDEVQLIKWFTPQIVILEKFQHMKISHRDIKPANFLLIKQEIYLADFGIMKKVE